MAMDFSTGLGSGKGVIVLSLIVGCFAIFWPRVFYPMLQSSYSNQADSPPADEVLGTRLPGVLPCCHPVTFTKELNALFFTALCRLLSWRAGGGGAPAPRHEPWAPGAAGWCRDELARGCGVSLDEPTLERYRRGTESAAVEGRNLTRCLETVYGVWREEVRPPPPPQQQSAGGRPERRAAVHPSLRDAPPASPAGTHEMAQQPRRIMDKMARPGPQPGSRPTPGGYGAVPQGTKGAGAMSIIMPLYTVGIVVFFVYTVMKVMFKRPDSDDKEPQVQDFHLTTEYQRPAAAPRLRSGGPAPAAARPRQVVVRAAAQTDAEPPPKPAPAPPPKPAPAPQAAEDAEIDQLRRRLDRAEDAEIDQLRRRLEETERAMERIMKQMSTVSEKLNVANISSNIRAIKQDLWGSMDSVASDSAASELSVSMESLAQTEASLLSLEEDVDRVEKVAKAKSKDKKAKKRQVENGDKEQVCCCPATGSERLQELAS